MNELIECAGCHRHVRSQDPQCPFCGDALAAAPRAGGKTPRRWLMAGTMALGGWMSVASCAVYGAPSDDDTSNANTSSSSASTGGGGEGGAQSTGGAGGTDSTGGGGGAGGAGGGG